MTPSEAQDLSVKDFSEFSSNARLAAQISLAANGGASLGMLKFLTDVFGKPSADPLVPYLASAAGCYLLGVLLASVSIFLFSLAKFHWGVFWENAANEAKFQGKEVDINYGRTRAVVGGRLNKVAFWLLLLSMVLFVPGSVVALLGFVTVLL